MLEEESVIHAGANESPGLNELYAALAKAQAEMDSASKNGTNPHFRSSYSDLGSIVKASRAALVKHGLAVIQRLSCERGASYLLTRLCHASGQWIESKVPITPPKNDIQTFGSYVTYLRRYSYAALVGVVTGDDDDGEGAMLRNATPPPAPSIGPGQVKELSGLLSQLEEGREEILQAILAHYQIPSLGLLPSTQFDLVKSRLKTTLLKNEMDAAEAEEKE